jgi:hypothetical protein
MADRRLLRLGGDYRASDARDILCRSNRKGRASMTLPAWAVIAAITVIYPNGERIVQNYGIDKTWCGKSTRGFDLHGKGEMRISVSCRR